MLYTKKDLNQLDKQAKDPNLGPTVRQYYKDCIKAIKEHGKVDTTTVKNDES